MGYFLPARSDDAVLQIRRDGNSLVLTLPKTILRTLGWKRGDYVAARVDKGILKASKVCIDFLMLGGAK